MDNLENVSIESEREAKIEKEKVTELATRKMPI